MNTYNHYPQENRFHDLLLKQQRQQLSILSELNKISKSLKSAVFQGGELFDDGELNDYELQDEYENNEEEEEDSMDNNNSWFSNLESTSGISIEQNQALSQRPCTKHMHRVGEPSTKRNINYNVNNHHSENIGEKF